ncbi:hypothetical protein LWI29_002202 [Acer saccharum]|uniref:Uncharacterized protein n=1 Tax=Acer saccharum TaxID=4024 RepID=A0AA39RU86_ACESA|nr:hypothetical protein LWI29_002202 [Acer saccharum]
MAPESTLIAEQNKAFENALAIYSDKDITEERVTKLVSEQGSDLQNFLMPETRSGHSYNIMDQGSTIPNPPNPLPKLDANTSQASSNFQQQLDQMSQTLNMVLHRLDVFDERSSQEVGRLPREARRVPRRREGIM